MSNDWPIEVDFADAFHNSQKRMMRQERRPPGITSASQILGPGAGPFAVLINDWDDEAATFNGIYYSAPGSMNAPDTDGDPPGSPSQNWWLGETFGVEMEDDPEGLAPDGGRWGFQRLSRFRRIADVAGAPPVDWQVRIRRFFPFEETVTYTAWLIV